MISVIAAVLGIALIVVVLQDAFEVVLLPRRVHRRIRLTRFYFHASWTVWSAIAQRLPPTEQRERFLGVFGPLSMVVLFGLWATTLIGGFGLLQWAIEGTHPGTPTSLGSQLYMSGVTFFTVGFGDVVPHSTAAKASAVAEGGTGIGYIALVIGYLPVLYQLFSRREAHVIQLDARAGSPPAAATMLSRHAEARGLAKLDDLLREWEVWGSEMLESHLSYPMLVYYRSQHENQSWLAATTTIIDTCALIMIGVDQVPPLQARMTFTMARQVLIEMAFSLRVRPARYDGGDRLPHDEFERLIAILQEAGINWNGGDAAEETLAALRATYEPLVSGLGTALLLPVPDWIAAEDASDHWQGGHRGVIVSRLIAHLTEMPARMAGGKVQADDGSRARRLLARLRRPA